MKKIIAQIIIGCVLIMGSVNIAYPCYSSVFYDFIVQWDTCEMSFPMECPECAAWLDDFVSETHCCRKLRGTAIASLDYPPYDVIPGYSEFCDVSCRIEGLPEGDNPFPLH